MNSNTAILRGLKWTAIERFSNQIIQFLVSIIIARIVSPNDYGILGILLVFINISQVFVDSGFGSSLVYNNKIEDKYLNTTFVFNLSISTIIVIVLYFFAPLIQDFYQYEKLSLYIRVSSLVLITNSIIVVPTAILKIKLDFRALAVSNLCSNIFSAFVGISMACWEFGIWALICQLLVKSLSQSVLIIFQCKWLPKLKFNSQSFMRLYKYGVNILGTSMLTKFTDEGISVIIAKFLSPYSLGIFTRSSQFATFPTSSIGSIINTVLFPSLSSLKGKRDEYSQLYRKSIEVQAAFCIPMYFLIAMSAHSIVVLLLTKKWIDVVPILQILCIGRILAIIAISTEQNLIASGHSNLYLKQQLLKLILKVSLILIALPFGLIAIAVADAMQTLCQFFITNYVASNITKFNTKEQLMKIYPFIFSSIFAALIGFVVTMNIDNIFIQLLLSIVVFIIAFFIIILRIFKTETYKYIVHQLHIRNKLK